MTNPGLAVLDSEIFGSLLAAGLGDSATFYRAGDGIGIACTAIVDKSVLYEDLASGIASRGTIISVQRAEIGSADPDVGSFFVVGREQYVVDKILETTDESRLQLLVTRKGC